MIYSLDGGSIESRELLQADIEQPREPWHAQSHFPELKARKLYVLFLTRKNYTGLRGASVYFTPEDLRRLQHGHILVSRYVDGAVRREYIDRAHFIQRSLDRC